MSALVPYSPGVQDAHEQELESAFLAKVISQDEYDERLRAHRGETRIVQLPTRMKAGTMVANTSGISPEQVFRTLQDLRLGSARPAGRD